MYKSTDSLPCCRTIIFVNIGVTLVSSLIITLEGELTATEFKLVRDIPTIPAEIRNFHKMNENSWS